jgi:hypothetical protein
MRIFGNLKTLVLSERTFQESIKPENFFAQSNPLMYHSPGILLKGRLTTGAKTELDKQNYVLEYENLNNYTSNSILKKIVRRVKYIIKLSINIIKW